MGQKIHPNGFRLGIVQDHQSLWFENKNSYAQTIQEDFHIRELIHSFFDKTNLTLSEELVISNISICRHIQNKLIFIRIATLNIDKLVQEQNLKQLKLLEKKLQQKFGTQKTFKIVPEIIEEEYKDANLVGRKIVKNLRNRVPFKRAIKEVLMACRQAGIYGVKIQVAGRLNGVEIARSEWRREGRVPLHTLRAKISYSHQS
mgnify:FL=1